MSRTRFLVLALLASAAVVAWQPALAGPPEVVPAVNPLPGHYIVTLEPTALARPGTEGLGTAARPELPAVAEMGLELAALHGAAPPSRVYRTVLAGFALEASPEAARSLAVDPRVARVEEDGRVHAAAGSQIAPPSWGLDRVDQRLSDLDGLYRYQGGGSGVHLFVVDSGVRATHLDFGGRVDVGNALDLVGDGRGTDDCTGHGTAVAALAAGSTYGVAKAATVHPVRVLDCTNQGAASDVIAAIDWVTATFLDHQKGNPSTHWRAVANLSLTVGAASSTLNQALYTSIAEGITWVAAAGNDGTDPCGLLTPVLGLPEVIVVGASDGVDAVAPFSNTGSCVDLFAPGSDLTTAGIADDTASIGAGGTSMAAPHAAGAAILYLEGNPEALPAEVQDALVAGATEGALTGVDVGTPNRLLFTLLAEEAGGSAQSRPGRSKR